MTADRPSRPFIAMFGSILHSSREQVLRYDEERQVSVPVRNVGGADDLRTSAQIGPGTRMTKIAHETTDDD